MDQAQYVTPDSMCYVSSKLDQRTVEYASLLVYLYVHSSWHTSNITIGWLRGIVLLRIMDDERTGSMRPLILKQSHITLTTQEDEVIYYISVLESNSATIPSGLMKYSDVDNMMDKFSVADILELVETISIDETLKFVLSPKG